MAQSAILVDLDGTIWNSIPWYSGVLSAGNATLAADLERNLRRGESLITMAARRGVSKASLVRKCRECIDDLELYAGVRKTLEILNDKRVPMGVVTSLSGDLAMLMLEGTGIRPYFRTVIHPGNCRSSKASGLPLRRALDDLRIAPSPKVLYIGDREDDAACACACGVSFAWASYGYGLQPPKTSVLLSKFGEVLAL